MTDHMEEDVQIKVQVEEEEGEIGETHGGNKARNRESKNGHPQNLDDHVDDTKRARADT